ncbi:MAG: rhomboid family intramembrane serine protease [Flavobacteriaceae bacterium]
MFIPINDGNAMRFLPFQYVTVALIAANVCIFVVFQSGIVFDAAQATAFGYGMIPAVYNELRVLPPEVQGASPVVTLVTYQFLHGSWMHLISNMLFLWVFGDNVEDALGHLRFLVFYLLCGIVAGLAHGFMMPASEMPLVGASGAVAGIVSAYLMLHPHVRIWVLALGRLPLRLPAWVVLGLWIASQIVAVIIASPDDEVAWWAHIGGLAAGAVLVVFLKRRDVPLFDRGLA